MLFLVRQNGSWSVVAGPKIPISGIDIVGVPETEGTRRFEELLKALPGDSFSILETLSHTVNTAIENTTPSD